MKRKTDTTEFLYEFAGFRLMPEERMLLRYDGQPVQLPPRIFDTLVALVERSGHLVEKDELLETVWADSFVEESTLTRNISILRKVLGETEDGQKYIETVPKRGYRFTESVTKKCPLPATESKPVSEEKQTILRRKTRRPVLWLMFGFFIVVGIFTSLSFWNTRGENPAAMKSIAVLPFKQIGGGEHDQSLELGMADAVIMRLGRIKQAVVRPTSAVSKYLDSNTEAIRAGRELQADAVLEGTIQREQDRVRVTARLIKSNDGAQLWAETLEAKFTDIFAVQDSISMQIAESLNLKLSGDEKDSFAHSKTLNPQAYEFFIKGKYFLEKRELQKAIDYFTQTIVLDPNFADAYTGLADGYALQVSYAVRPPGENLPKARTAMERSLELAADSPEAHATFGHILWLSWDWQNAEKEFQRALELNPNSVMARSRYSVYLSSMARHGEAIAEARRAAELDPTSFVVSEVVERAYFFARRYDEALAASEKTLELNPNAIGVNSWREMTFEQKGMRDQAIETRLIGMSGRKSLPEDVEDFRRTYREQGWQAFWQKNIDRQKQEAATNKFYVLPYGLARNYARLGDYEQALSWLERCEQEHSDHLTLVKVDPLFDRLRDDPRFTALLKRINLN